MKQLGVLIILIILVAHFNRHYLIKNLQNTFLITRRKYFYDNEWFKKNLFSAFTNISNIGLGDFPDDLNLNIDMFAKNRYGIVNMSNELSAVENVINNKNVNANLKVIVEKALQHVNLHGRKISINDVVIVDVLKNKGAYFPKFHTDIEWGVFDKSEGFQIWYLYENDESYGNMFILDTPQVLPSSELQMSQEKIIIREQCDKETITIADPHMLDDPMYYLDMKKGECFIMNKNVYHTSDIRNNPNRSAVNLRIVIKDPDGGIPVNYDQSCPYNMFMKRYRGSKVRNGKIYPGLFDMLELI